MQTGWSLYVLSCPSLCPWPMVSRLLQLTGVTRGLVYMHDQGIVHGNLDGVCVSTPHSPTSRSRRHKRNIMIDDNGRAVIAGFSLITLVPGQSTFLSSWADAGTVRWMSPELLNPEKFGLSRRQQTKESDCYALGMVAYETLSGCAPFGTNRPFTVLRKILDGEHPERPQGEAGELFTDDIWNVLDCCWDTEPRERASARDMLWCLEGSSPAVERDSDATSCDSFYHELDDVGDGSGGSSLLCFKHLLNRRRSLLTTPKENRPLNPPFDSSPIVSHSLVPGRFPTSPQAGTRWVRDWLVYITWNAFDMITRYFRSLW